MEPRLAPHRDLDLVQLPQCLPCERWGQTWRARSTQQVTETNRKVTATTGVSRHIQWALAPSSVKDAAPSRKTRPVTNCHVRKSFISRRPFLNRLPVLYRFAPHGGARDHHHGPRDDPPAGSRPTSAPGLGVSRRACSERSDLAERHLSAYDGTTTNSKVTLGPRASRRSTRSSGGVHGS